MTATVLRFLGRAGTATAPSQAEPVPPSRTPVTVEGGTDPSDPFHLTRQMIVVARRVIEHERDVDAIDLWHLCDNRPRVEAALRVARAEILIDRAFGEGQ
jgi:hypothetical protein